MKTFKQHLNESASQRVYHGDDYNTTKLVPELMFQQAGNNQEGIGIYFGELAVAKTYGKNIVSISVNKRNFRNARKDMDRVLTKKQFSNLLFKLNKIDNEFWYIYTDYGVEVNDKDEINYTDAYALYDMMGSEEMRNVQIELTQACEDPVNFIKAWERALPNIHGLFNDENGFYAVIRTKYKVKQEM